MDERVKKIIDKSKSIAFFGGAGVSTESGIPDFRSEAGLYSAQSEYGFSPEQMLSHSFFMGNMKTFFDYYKKNLVYKDAQPNKAHYALAKFDHFPLTKNEASRPGASFFVRRITHPPNRLCCRHAFCGNDRRPYRASSTEGVSRICGRCVS